MPIAVPGEVKYSGSIVAVGDSVAAMSAAGRVGAGFKPAPTGANFARPKSRIFACPWVVMKIFAGLMSR